jgi:hypothetical protein
MCQLDWVKEYPGYLIQHYFWVCVRVFLGKYSMWINVRGLHLIFLLMVLYAVCDQKILVFVFQMEKSKQSMWMGWGRVALLREGVTCPARWGKGSRKRGHDECRWNQPAKRLPLKPTLPHGKAGPGGSHPKWMSGKGHGQFSARWGWSGPSPGNLHEPQTFPTSSLPHFESLNTTKMWKKNEFVLSDCFRRKGHQCSLYWYWESPLATLVLRP